MAINNIIPAQMIPQVAFTTPVQAPNGMMYPQTNAGKIIGGALGTISGMTSTISPTGIPVIDAGIMSAIGIGIGAAIDSLISNKQRAEVMNQINYNA